MRSRSRSPQVRAAAPTTAATPELTEHRVAGEVLWEGFEAAARGFHRWCACEARTYHACRIGHHGRCISRNGPRIAEHAGTVVDRGGFVVAVIQGSAPLRRSVLGDGSLGMLVCEGGPISAGASCGFRGG
ncbi:DUF6248 family natural product biosynthesis protein [Streptomyces griseorubiginosus]|uniref:DUF6248 family natural product biosynthesis protein n=1 Tax=Streptomyces griseorubiginosus TaxID=67304 RepID=UPI003455945C